VIGMLDGMPDGVLGFRATGKLTAEDYSEGMMPALREAAEAGEMRIVYVLGEDFHGLDAGAMVQDVKAGFELTVGHRSAWKRLAMVTDLDWIRHSVHLLGWLAPGELRLFELDRLEEAVAWAAS
jgi:SpoIIAA-like